MINTHLLKLPLSRTYFHGPKGVRAIEVRLYSNFFIVGIQSVKHSTVTSLMSLFQLTVHYMSLDIRLCGTPFDTNSKSRGQTV